jgi:putative toxin-antitoxin system antitoxin component (TIGR02293 family)
MTSAEAGGLQQVAALLGGPRVLRHALRDALDAHELLSEGLPGEALLYLVGRLVRLQPSASLERAMGMSLRTFQRHKTAPARPLNQEQSGRAWTFAGILARATRVFGSQDEAEQWLERRPLDLLATPAGVKLVEDHLERLEHGVYA